MTGRTLTIRMLLSVCCASLLSFGLAACVMTGFGIPAELPVLLRVAAGAAVVYTVIFCVWYPGLWMTFSLITGGFTILLTRIELRDSFYVVWERIAAPYLRNFSIFDGYSLHLSIPASADGTKALAVCVVLLAALTAWTVNRRVSFLPLGGICGAILVLCLMNLSTEPAVWAILPVFGVMALLVLTGSERHLGRFWTLGAILPIAGLLVLLLFFVRPASYQRPAWADGLVNDFRRLTSSLTMLETNAATGQMQWVSPFDRDTLGSSPWTSSRTEIDLTRIGPQTKTGEHVMDVRSPRRGQIYLRGYSFDYYDGSGWYATADVPQWDESMFLTSEGGRGGEEIVISTNGRSRVLYLPYTPDGLPAGGIWQGDRYVENDLRSTVYTVDYTPSLYLNAADEEYEAYVRETYLQVPEETRKIFADWVARYQEKAAEEYAPGYGVDPISRVTSGSQRGKPYSLNTPQAPEGVDFVSWFWLESETGYCVHFASTAVMMLRCLDIPARYVSGYLVDVEADQWCAVTTDDAHAWVEYYVPGIGWRFLETTAPGSVGYDPRPSQTEDLPAQEPGDVETTPTTPETPDVPVLPEEAPVTDVTLPMPEQENLTEELPRYGFSLPLYFEEMPPTGQIMIPFWLWFPAAILLPILLLGSLPLLWIAVVRALRRRRRRRGSRNDQARYAYRELCFLSRMAGKKVPEEQERLALRAAFGRDPVNEEELAALQAQCADLRQSLRAERDGRWFYIHVILAIEA